LNHAEDHERPARSGRRPPLRPDDGTAASHAAVSERRSDARQPIWRFLRAALGALVRGRYGLRGGHLPPAGHVVPADFTGVGVATSGDPAVDRYVLTQLAALGTRQVRIDFSYGDADGPAARLLDALLEAGFRVMLHLVQPLHAAREMHTDNARAAWRAFVAATLDRWGARVEMVEVCSTVNRKRWAGYTLQGFLNAWEIAHDEVRRRGFVLAGPSVTDFEPPWNAGLLALLAERGLLPDIHTDNLFSERCTEPERWDHKLLGHRLAPLLRYNLVKKARVLQRLGAEAGIARLISPAAFWTLPRIERRLPDSEQKQADYLARYLVLCAASGALERACWGPLICHREGLIDDGGHPYPALERITHYAAVAGTCDAFRLLPAFHAMAAFNRLIPGSRYDGRLGNGQGLEVHAFTSATHRLHAVWTVNGRAAPLVDLYDAETLAAAECIDRDGRVQTDVPTLATEAPIYLQWAASGSAPRVGHTTEYDLAQRAGDRNTGSKVLHRVARRIRRAPLSFDPAPFILHAHGDGRHYYYRDDTWHGIVRAASRAEADALIHALHPSRIGRPQRSAILRHARNAIWTVADPRRPDDAGARLVVKQPVTHLLHKQLLDRLKPSKARRSWNGASELLRRGLGTATPVAWFEQRSGCDLTQNWYVCDYIDGALSVRELFSAYAAGHDAHAGIAAEDAYKQLCAFLLKLHGGGVFFRDLSGGNILVRKAPGGKLDFALIDTARVRIYRNGVPLRKRLADLSRACYKLHPEGRARFMALYLGELDYRAGALAQLPLRLYDIKVALKRRLRNTRLYRMLKR
jgi:hypothetical protein